jgi:hypothetical protein
VKAAEEGSRRELQLQVVSKLLDIFMSFAPCGAKALPKQLQYCLFHSSIANCQWQFPSYIRASYIYIYVRVVLQLQDCKHVKTILRKQPQLGLKQMKSVASYSKTNASSSQSFRKQPSFNRRSMINPSFNDHEYIQHTSMPSIMN